MRRIAGVRVSSLRAVEGDDGMQLSSGGPSADLSTRRQGTALALPWWVETKEIDFWKHYRRFLGVTAALHLGSGIATTVLIFTTKSDWPTHLCASYTVWRADHLGFPCFKSLYNSTNGTLSTVSSPNATSVVNLCNRHTAWKHAGTLDPSWMVAAFFYLSAFFQFLPVQNVLPRINYVTYRNWLLSGVQPLRFIEYSISSTLMVLVIALLNGATDLWLLLSLSAANWCCMMFGLFHEQLLRLRAERMELGTNFFDHMAAHLAGWVPFVAVWTVLLSQFEWSIGSLKGVPMVIKFILPVQLFMFALFGLNQLLGSLARRDLPASEVPALLEVPKASQGPPTRRYWWTYMHSEVGYTVLSLTAKTLLAWMLLGGAMRQDPKKLVTHSLC